MNPPLKARLEGIGLPEVPVTDNPFRVALPQMRLAVAETKKPLPGKPFTVDPSTGKVR